MVGGYVLQGPAHRTCSLSRKRTPQGIPSLDDLGLYRTSQMNNLSPGSFSQQLFPNVLSCATTRVVIAESEQRKFYGIMIWRYEPNLPIK